MMTQAARLEYFGRLLLFSPQAAGRVLRPEPTNTFLMPLFLSTLHQLNITL